MGINIDIMDVVDAKRLRWYGHIQRMTESRWPKKILKWLPQRNRKRGRPRKTWEKEIEKAMKERDLQEEDWEDRRTWRLGCEKRRQL